MVVIIILISFIIGLISSDKNLLPIRIKIEQSEYKNNTEEIKNTNPDLKNKNMILKPQKEKVKIEEINKTKDFFKSIPPLSINKIIL